MAGSTLKVHRIKGAYSQLRINGLTLEPTPADLDLALDRLENMAAEWESSNICAGYNFEDEPDPSSEIGVPREFWQCFDTNLAIRLIPDFNKAVPDILMRLATGSLNNLSARSAMNRLRQVQYPSRQPRGSGNTHRYYRWNQFYQQSEQTPNNCKTHKLKVNDVDDYIEHFDSYLNANEAISSYSVVADSGLTISSDSKTSSDILYRVKAGANKNNFQQVTIIITTSDDRIETRFVYFEIE